MLQELVHDQLQRFGQRYGAGKCDRAETDKQCPHHGTHPAPVNETRNIRNDGTGVKIADMNHRDIESADNRSHHIMRVKP